MTETVSGSNNPLVSIIIPAYNTAQYIHRAIESSLRQTYTNIEVIVTDDGSGDDTLTTARSYEARDSRIHVFTQENSGVSAARNHGMSEADGEYFMFLDSDDWLEDDAVANLLEAQAEHPDKLISANFYFAKIEGGNIVRKLVNPESLPSCPLTYDQVGASMCTYFPRDFSSACWKIFKAEYCSKFREDIRYSEDAVFVQEYLYRMSGAYYVNKAVYDCLIRSGSASHFMRYDPRYLPHQIEANGILRNNPNNSPDFREWMIIRKIGLEGLTYTLMPNIEISSADVKAIRDNAKSCAREYLRLKKVGIKDKFKLVCRLYLPLPLSRLIRRVKMFMNRLCKFMRSPEYEVIPYW